MEMKCHSNTSRGETQIFGSGKVKRIYSILFFLVITTKILGHLAKVPK
jgi:hypothetical protein